MWSKRNCIGSLDWFHPIKQWHSTSGPVHSYSRNARSFNVKLKAKRTDHSEFQVKTHVPMINLSVQIVVNISIAKMLQSQVRFSFCLPLGTRSLLLTHSLSHKHALTLTHCISWFSSICRQWNKFVSVSRCSVCSWRHWQNREVRVNSFRLDPIPFAFPFLLVLVQFVQSEDVWTYIWFSVLVLNIT